MLLKTKYTIKSFEFLLCNLNLNNKNVKLVNIYRPLYSQKHHFLRKTFLKEFHNFLSKIVQFPGDLLALSDFNLHLENTNDKYISDLNSLLNTYSLNQLVHLATHVQGGTLDLVIKNCDLYINDTIVDATFQTDHYPILIKMSCFAQHKKKVCVYRRNFHNLKIDELQKDIKHSPLCDKKYFKTLKP